MTSYEYIADHIVRIEGILACYPQRILDSKWRIASHVGLFPEADPYLDPSLAPFDGSIPYPPLDPSGRLSPEQEYAIDLYIWKFKSCPAGQRAILEHQSAAACHWEKVEGT